MANPVIVEWIVKGIPNVQRAARSVAESVAAAEQAATRAAEREAAKRNRIAQQEAQAKKRVKERSAKDEWRVIEQGIRDNARAHQQATREVERITESARRRARANFERDEREKNRTAMQWVRKRESEERQSAASRARFNERLGGAASRGVGAAVRGVSAMAGIVGQLGGGFSIADALGSNAKARGRAAEISNSGFLPGDARNGNRMSTSELMGAAKTAGRPMGFSDDETLQGLQVFTAKAGDLQTGLQLLPKLTELARATGASMDDLAGSAAEVFNSNTKQSAEDVMLTMRGIAGMGKVAAVEIKDLAAQMSKVTASAGLFSGNKEQNVITLTAMAQEARLRGGAANAAQATTAVARFGSDVAKGTDKFRAVGVETKTKDGVLRGPQEIIQDTLLKTKGDVSAVTKLFGERSAKSVLGFAEIYRNAGGHTDDPQKQKQAMAAVTAEFERLRKVQMSEAEARESAARRMEEADMKFTQLVLDLKEAVSRELLPQLTALVPQFSKLVPLMGDAAKAVGTFVQYFANNPMKGLAALVAVSMTKELAAVGFQSLFAKALSTQLGQAGLVVGTAVIAAQLGMITIDAMASDLNKQQGDSLGKSNEAHGEAMTLQRKVREGKATPEDVAKLGKLRTEMASQVEQEQANVHKKSTLEKVMGPIDSVYGKIVGQSSRSGDEASEYQKDRDNRLQQSKDALTELNKALEAATTSLKKMGSTAGQTDLDSTKHPAPNRGTPITNRN